MLPSFRLAIFDLDGTLFRGEEPIPGAVETLERLRNRGVAIRYLTNNSSQTRAAYVDKLTRLGFRASEEEVFSSAIGTGHYLAAQGIKSAFVVGESGLKDTIAGFGVKLFGPRVEGLSYEPGLQTSAELPDAVVVGICKTFTYGIMNRAMQHIRNGARFIATNIDPTYPMEEGKFIPGAGSIVAAIRTCSEREPTIIGKPEPFLVEMILKEAGVDASEALVVGDRMDTDIEAGKRAGCPTLLVLTGAATSAPDGQTFLPSVSEMAKISDQ